MSKVGRPTALTPEIQARICEALRDGNYYEAACKKAGIGYNTFRKWMIRGKRSRGKFREFMEAVHKAEADAETTIVAEWRKQCPENWQACRDFLGRRHPDRWGPKEKLEHKGQLTVTAVDWDTVSRELDSEEPKLIEGKLAELPAPREPANGHANGNGTCHPT